MAGQDARRRAAEQRRLARVFGEVLPEDEAHSEAGAGREDAAAREAELVREVPPHHG